MFDLTGKSALITGAAGGVGSEVARAMHKLGAAVGISDLSEELLAPLKEELGDNAHILPCNLRDEAEVKSLVGEATKAMGGVDILVNCAGIVRDRSILRMKKEDWRAVLDVNLDAPFLICQSAVRGMLRNNWGRIINVTSVAGHRGTPGQANYTATKAGVAGMTRSIAYELAERGITANVVAPGMINTPMVDVLTEEQLNYWVSLTPVGRMAEPEEIAAAVVFLATPEASYITGSVLHVNGGIAML